MRRAADFAALAFGRSRARFVRRFDRTVRASEVGKASLLHEEQVSDDRPTSSYGEKLQVRCLPKQPSRRGPSSLPLGVAS
ncbi:MAG: hypothetical protein CL489_02625 [Acidobacteria bacterium]|nr:hypothetical protein [Acidobacteriota bacterium]